MGGLSFEELSIDFLGPEHALVRGRFRLHMKDAKPTGLFTLILRRTRRLAHHPRSYVLMTPRGSVVFREPKSTRLWRCPGLWTFVRTIPVTLFQRSV